MSMLLLVSYHMGKKSSEILISERTDIVCLSKTSKHVVRNTAQAASFTACTPLTQPINLDSVHTDVNKVVTYLVSSHTSHMAYLYLIVEHEQETL